MHLLKGLYNAEINIARIMKELNQGNPPWNIEKTEEAIHWAQKKLDVTLADSQKKALHKALHVNWR